MKLTRKQIIDKIKQRTKRYISYFDWKNNLIGISFTGVNINDDYGWGNKEGKLKLHKRPRNVFCN